MLAYLGQRVIFMILTFAILTVLVFAIIQLPPGDYLSSHIAALMERGDTVNKEEIEALKKFYGLDEPIYTQYIYWLGKFLRGNMGQSFEWQKPVADLLRQRLPFTILLTVFTLIFTYAVAVPIGIYSATHQYSPGDYFFSVVGFAGLATPNVIVFLTDDQGYGDLSVYGNGDLQTPNIDRLAQEGVRLTQHYSGSPICAPARASLLTGRYNHRVGALSVESNRGLDRISLRYATIADMFKSAGYATGMVGKWHNGVFDMRYHPNNRGFDEFVGFLNGGMPYFEWVLERNGESFGSDGRYLTDLFTQEGVGFIERHKDEPFFLYVAYNAPHSPLEAPEEEIKPFRETEKFNKTVSTIYGMIRRMDKGVGRILETLEKNGLSENTIVLFTSDNGPYLGGDGEESYMRYNGPFRGMKYDVLEGGIRVPAILRWPGGLPQGVEHHEMVHFTDWLPTLLSAAGIETSPDLPLDGINVLELLRGESEKVDTNRFWQFNRYDPVPSCNAAMRDGDWKLYWPKIPEAMGKSQVDNVWYQGMFHVAHFETEIDRSHFERELSSPGKPELYNIGEDAYEENDLAEKYPERLAKMKSELETWFETVESERLSLPENQV